MTSGISIVIRTTSPEETHTTGAAIGRSLRGAVVLSLEGPLGSGKTVLTAGICEGLGVEDPVTSPTFTLQNQYANPSGRRVLHMDCFRLESAAEFDSLAAEDLMEEDTVQIVEWGDRVGGALGFDVIRVSIEPGEGDERRIAIHVPPGIELAMPASSPSSEAE